jgi:hypothetical protein
MLYPDPYVAKLIVEERMRDVLREAEAHRLLRQAGIGQRGWLSRQAGRLLFSLGDLLVGLGRRLERYEVLPVVACPELQMACEAETC